MGKGPSRTRKGSKVAKATTVALVGIGLVAMVITVAIVMKPSVQPVRNGDDACHYPVGVVAITDRDVSLVNAAVGEVANGGFHASQNTEVVQLLGDSAKAELLIDYEICAAQQRGDIERNNAPQAIFLRELLEYARTNPGPTAIDAWITSHQMPPSVNRTPTGMLSTPDFRRAGDQLVYEMKSISRNYFTISNIGSAGFTFEFEQFPGDDLLLSPDGEKPITLSPGNSEQFNVGLLYGSKLLLADSQFVLATNLTDPVDNANAQKLSRIIRITLTDRDHYQSHLNSTGARITARLIKDFNSRLGSTTGSTQPSAQRNILVSVLGISPAYADVDADIFSSSEEMESMLIHSARSAVAEGIGSTNADSVDLVLGEFFEAANWPSLAERVYISLRSRTAPPVSTALDRVIARTHRLASLEPAEASADALQDSYIWESTFNNPLASEGNLEFAAILATKLYSSKWSRQLGLSLSGDIAARKGKYLEASKEYDAAMESGATRSLSIREYVSSALNKTNPYQSYWRLLKRLNTAALSHSDFFKAASHSPMIGSARDKFLVAEAGDFLTSKNKLTSWSMYTGRPAPSIVSIPGPEAINAFCAGVDYPYPDILYSPKLSEKIESACTKRVGEIKSYTENGPSLGISAKSKLGSHPLTVPDLQLIINSVLEKNDRYFHSRETTELAYAQLNENSSTLADLIAGAIPSVCDDRTIFNCAVALRSALYGGELERAGLVFVEISDPSRQDLLAVGGVQPSLESIKSGQYPLTMKYVWYVKTDEGRFMPLINDLTADWDSTAKTQN